MKVIYFLNLVLSTIFISYSIAYSIIKAINVELSNEIMFKVWASLLPIWIVIFLLSLAAGYPNNEIKSVLYIDVSRNKNKKLTVYVNEIEKGKWQIIDFNEIIDMKGWVNQKTLITRLIKTRIILEIYNKNKDPFYSLDLGNQYSMVKEMLLIFVHLNGKKSKKLIIKNHRVLKSIPLRIWLALMTNQQSGGPRYREYQLKDFYIGKRKKSNKVKKNNQ